MKLGPGTLYGALSRLEGKGLIEALPSDDRRRPYKITAAGSEALGEQLRMLDRVVETGMKRLRAAGAGVMSARLARLALALYPRAYRRRYGEEIEALVEDQGASPRAVADLLRGAARAHLRPEPGLAPGARPGREHLKLGVSAILFAWVLFALRRPRPLQDDRGAGPSPAPATPTGSSARLTWRSRSSPSSSPAAVVLGAAPLVLAALRQARERPAARAGGGPRRRLLSAPSASPPRGWSSSPTPERWTGRWPRRPGPGALDRGGARRRDRLRARRPARPTSRSRCPGGTLRVAPASGRRRLPSAWSGSPSPPPSTSPPSCAMHRLWPARATGRSEVLSVGASLAVVLAVMIAACVPALANVSRLRAGTPRRTGR